MWHIIGIICIAWIVFKLFDAISDAGAPKPSVFDDDTSDAQRKRDSHYGQWS